MTTDAMLPLSHEQEWMMLLRRLRSDAHVELPLRFRVSSAVDDGAIHRAMRRLAQRHAVLRTTIGRHRGRFVQRVAASVDDTPSGDLLWRYTITGGRENRRLELTADHVIADGISMRLLARDAAALVRSVVAGVEVSLPQVELDFPDYVRANRQTLDGRRRRELSVEWRRVLHGAEPLFSGLDPGRLRRPRRGRAALRSVSADDAAGLRALGRAQRCTEFMVAYAAIVAVLAREFRTRDVLLGTVLSKRIMAGLENTVGCIAGLVPVRTIVPAGGGFLPTLAATREALATSFEYGELPIMAVARATPALFSTQVASIVFQMSAPRGEGKLDELLVPIAAPGVSGEVWNHPATFDLQIIVDPDRDGSWRVYCLYDAGVFADETIARLLEGFVTALRDATQSSIETDVARTMEAPTVD